MPNNPISCASLSRFFALVAMSAFLPLFALGQNSEVPSDGGGAPTLLGTGDMALSVFNSDGYDIGFVPRTDTQSSTSLGMPDNNWSASSLAVVCEVTVDAISGANTLCTSPLPPPENNCDCNGKMQNLTLEYLGPSGRTVTAYDGDGSSATLIATFPSVSNGEVLYVSAETLAGADFEAWTSFYTCSSTAGGSDDNGCTHSEIHTSCSQDILGMTFGDFHVLGYTDGQGDQCGTLGSEAQLGCNGTIDLTASNGESPYGYLWSDGSTDEDRNGLCAGTYSVTVTDANGCSTGIDVVVEDDPGAVTVEVSVEANTACTGGSSDCTCSGYLYEFTVVYNGPSGIVGGAYDYHDNTYGEWTLQSGESYTFNVSNSNHPGEDHQHNDPMMWTLEGDWVHHGTYDATCGQSNIGQAFGPFTLTGFVDVHGNACGGSSGCNGVAHVTITEGEAPFTYLWSDGSMAEDRSNLCAGTHQLTVTDAGGCSSTVDVLVDDNPGTVGVEVTTEANTVCSTPLPPAENNCGCEGKMQNFTVEYTGPAGATVTAYDDDDESAILIATYSNVSQGAILFISGEGLSGDDLEPRTYLYVDGGNEADIHTSCSQNILDMTFGDFTVLGFTDGQGDQCGILADGNYGGCNGVAHVTATEGEAPFAYLWSDGSTAEDRSDLCAGTYQLTVTDAGGCSSTVDVVVDDNPGTVEVEVTTEANTVCSPPLPPAENNCDCEGKMQNFTVEYNGPAGATVTAYDDDDGSAILIVTYTNVSPGEVLFISGEDLSGADLETRTYLYVDGGNEADIHTSCSQNILDMTFGDFTVLGFTDGQGDQCGILGDGNYGGCNGTAQVTVTEGEAPFAYLWSDGSTAEDRSDLCAGTYQLTVTDAGGCSSTVDVVVDDNPATVNVEVETEANSVCDAEPAECTCEAYLYAFTVVYNGPSNITGGAYDYHDNTYGEWSLQTGDSYTFNVSNSNHPGEDHAHNDPMMWTHEGEWIHHGTYDATCGQSDIGQTFGPFTLTGFVDAHGNECTGSPACNGSAVVTASSGEAPYTYLWSDGGTTATRSELCPGTYEVEVTDANGCLGTQTVTIGQGSELDLTVSTSDETCPGTCDGSAHVSVVGGTGNHTILWSNGATTADLTGLCAGEYNVTVTDGDCESTETVTISSGDAPEVTVTSMDPNCDDNNGSITFTFVDNADRAHIEFSIDGGVTWPEAYKTLDDVGSFTIENLTGQTYGLLVRWGNDECEVDLPDVTLEPGCFSTPQVLTGVDPQVTLQCGEPIPSDAPAFEDACGGALIVAHTSLENDLDCANSYELVRTWTATNGCEQSATVTQTITVVDTVGPAITCPSDALTLECGDSVHPDNTGHATAGDDCSTVVLTYHDGEDTDASDCVETFVRTWTATDACANTSTCEQTIALTDTEQPYWTSDLPGDLTLQCGEAIPSQPTLTASDACQGDLEVAMAQSSSTGGCGSTSVTLYVWTATDGCTESISHTQTITVVDTVGPAITCPSDAITLECGDSVHPDNTGHATAGDDCSTVVLTYHDGEDTDASDCVETFVRTWTATDACANTSTCEQTITLTDTEQPYWTSDLPGDLTLQCGEAIPSQATLTASDACQGDLEVVMAQSSSAGSCGNTSVTLYVWTATDGCTESISHTQTITVVDTVGPAITCPSDALTLECGDSVHPDNTGHATAGDDCSTVVLTYHDGEDTDASDCVETFVRTWTATDACANTSTCEQTIALTDTEQPYWTSDLPANGTLACGAEAPTPSAVTASDACQGDLTVEVSEAYAAEGCGLTGVYTFTWTADDGCTEPISYTQTITVVNAPPTSTCPVNVSLECGASVHPDQTGYATGEDDCGEVTVTYVDVVEETAPACASTATITRTWTITDECELSVSCVQTIDFVDNEPPQITETCDISNGEVIELCCVGLNSPAEVPEACIIDYTDNCGASLTYTETTTGDVPGDSYLTCAVNTPEAFEDGETCTNLETHSLRLFGFPGATGPATFFSIVEGTGEVEYTDAENWTVTMRVVSNDRDDAGFDVSVTYGEGLGWEDWSARSVPSSYKRDCPDLPDLHEEWMYFIVQSGSLSGWGAYEGSSFSLTHQPANEYYGCQVGVAANNMNANYGFSGWLMYLGTLVEDGVETEVLSSGDLFGELDCCLPFTVSRTYLVEDCAGNATTFTYHVVSDGELCPEELSELEGQGHTPIVVAGNGNLLGNKTPISISNLAPNPTADNAEVRFTVNEPMRVRADLTDMSGNLIDQLFEGVVQPGITYTVDLEVESMASGMYQVRLASNSYLVVRKLLVTD